MCRFTIQLILKDKTRSTRYNTPKNDRYSNSSNDWTLVSLKFIVVNYGRKPIYEGIDSALADI